MSMLHGKKFIVGVVWCLATAGFGAVARADFVLSAPPRESAAAGEKLYGPLAEYLSQATGEKVIYRYPDNWGVYQAMVTKGEYDLVFDGPHLVSWRIARARHVPLAALAGKLGFVVVVLQDNSRTKKIGDLAGKRVCGHSPPNLATLTLFDQFPNPSRQPRLVEIKGFEAAYQGLVSGKCVGTILPTEVHKKLDAAARTRVLYLSEALPNQALTAGPRVTEAVRNRIKEALLSAAGRLNSRPVA
jgi:ABC-type phosphate/phosphonate transport system substrate-binding protein